MQPGSMTCSDVMVSALVVVGQTSFHAKMDLAEFGMILGMTSKVPVNSQIGCALALANFSFCQSSGPMVQHYCHE